MRLSLQPDCQNESMIFIEKVIMDLSDLLIRNGLTIKVPSGTVVVTHLFVKKILIKKTWLTIVYEWFLSVVSEKKI